MKDLFKKKEPKEQLRKRYIASQPKIYTFLVESKALTHYDRELQLAGPKEALNALARAIANSPLWAEMPKATLVARLAPQPVLAVLGCFDVPGEARLAAWGRELNRACTHLRYVSYAQAELDCQRLAVQLIERFGPEKLSRFSFTAIPRGGLIVLGMLAYMLGLEQTQLEPPHSPKVPLVVVDDCALSGNRFGRFLECCESNQVVFAHLYSHPDLRVAIEGREPRVIACLGAQDLHDHGPENLSDNYLAWQELWLNQLNSPRYWIGQPDRVCFAWNDPDSVWNPILERMEKGWHIVPPELCLKNRLGSGMKPIPIQVQPESKGPLKPSEHVLFGEFEGQIIVCNLETRESFSLTDVASHMWLAIVKHGNLEDVVVSLLRDYDVGEANLWIDLRTFVDCLLAQGLLEQRDASNPAY